MLIKFEPGESFQPMERLVCRVTTFDAQYDNSTDCTKFAMFTGTALAQDDVLTGVAAGVFNSPLQIHGKGIVIETPGFRALEQRTCKINPNIQGQLSYIDGCSNTNLVDPARNGDPCINYLFFPKGIDQTFHTHPSARIGYVLTGRGLASLKDEEILLEEGSMFLLERHTLHRFRTLDSTMSLMVFHPDSESGPTDEFNPMKSRTYIGNAR